MKTKTSKTKKRPQAGQTASLDSGPLLGQAPLTREQAIAKAIEWHELHDEAQCEEEAECFQAEERLRMEAADIEHDLREAGFDAHKLYEEYKRSRR